MSDIAATAPRAVAHPLVLRNFVHDLLVVLCLFLPYPQRRRFTGDARVVALALLAVLAVAALASYGSATRQAVGGEVAFVAWGLYATLSRLFLAVALLFLVAVASSCLHRLVGLLTGLLGVQVVVMAVEPFLRAAGDTAWERIFAFVCIAVVLRIAVRELDIAPARRSLAAVAVAGGLWAVAEKAPSIAMFRAEFGGDQRYSPLNVERVYLNQPRLVQATVDAVLPSRPEIEDTYFVGFASYSAQNVFENEVKHVAQLFRDQLGAEGRTALLVNSRDTVDELPLANGHNLAATLRGIAAKMGPEDVLFLHMTSHGSAEHEFSVYFENLGLNDLPADEIGDIVGSASLPWRVIVVAACYSGGYIEPLKSPRTLVITASRADRQSFGCEHGREYTYFGEAFYRDSLVAGDYRAAFDRAAAIVREREAREELTPSEPQIWIGEQIADKL